MKLIKAPDEFLEKKVNDFDFTKMDAEKISSEMFNIMKKYEGVGLAANQVGIDAQIFIMGEDKPMTIINPLVTEVSTNQVEMMEGCLSFPDIWVQVKRPKKVAVTWQNMNNEKLVQHLDGMESKCFQHELDHLDGINFNKRVSKMRWDMAKKKAMKT